MIGCGGWLGMVFMLQKAASCTPVVSSHVAFGRGEAAVTDAWWLGMVVRVWVEELATTF